MKTIMLSITKIALLLCAITITNAQTTYTVDNTPSSGAQFTDIQSAIDAASNGDTIYVQQSQTTYTADVYINKEINLIGRSVRDNFYSTVLSNIFLSDGCSGAKISGLKFTYLQIDSNNVLPMSNITVSNCSATHLSFNGTSQGGTISNVLIEGNDVSGISASNNVSGVTIKNNYINANSSFSPLNTSANSIVIRNNIIRGSLSTILNYFNPPVTIYDTVFITTDNFLRLRGSYSLNNCHIYNENDVNATVAILQALPNGAQFENVSNCTFLGDPLFVSLQGTTIEGSDFTLQPNSPLIGAGANGGNIGFQQNFIFKYLGNPKGVPEVKVTNYTGATSPNGTVTFNIEAKSH